MDKYEYKLKLEQIKNLVEAKDYKAAARIADGINWRKVKSVATLCMIGEIYERTKQLEESKEVYLMAYDRSPVGRTIIYRLTKVAIKLGAIEEAQEYYEEFIEVAPHDNAKYVLRYEIAKAKGASLQELIPILEEFKDREYTEEWAFELAYLYHKSGNVEKCVDICDELILWFGEGKYVEKALELKMLYQPLNKLQEDKYRRFKQKREGIVEVSPYEPLKSGEIVRETVTIPSIQQDATRFNTMNLQEELAKSMQQIMRAAQQETGNETTSGRRAADGRQVGVPTQSPKSRDRTAAEIAKTRDMSAIAEAMKTRDMSVIAEAVRMSMGGEAPAEEFSTKTYQSQSRPGEEYKAEGYSPEEYGVEGYPAEEYGAEGYSSEGYGAEGYQNEEYPVEGYPTEMYPTEGYLAANQSQGYQPEAYQSEGYQPKMYQPESFMGAEMPETALNINFKEIVSENYDNQVSLHVPEAPAPNLQITGQMSIEEILAEWDGIQQKNRSIIAEMGQQRMDALPKSVQIGTMVQEELRPVVEEAMQQVSVAEAAVRESTMTGMQEQQSRESVMSSMKEQTARESMMAGMKEQTTRESMMAGMQEQQSRESTMTGMQEQQSREAMMAGMQEQTARESVMEELVQEMTEEPQQEIQPNPMSDIEQKIMRQQAVVQQTLEQQIREEQILQQEVTLEETAEEKPITELSDEQKEIFTYFTLIDGMEKQICQALEGTKQRKKNNRTSVSGNLIIAGGKGSGKTVLATNFVKAYQRLIGKSSGKVGKISASMLNQKDIEKLAEAVKGGYLIIEKAGDLSKESVLKLSGLMERDTQGMLVILEDDADGLKKVLGRSAEFTKKFTEQLRVPVFTSDELVAFAKAYAREQNCEIEEMGVLALYNSISNIQKLDEATTLTEVQEIMDEAIYRANRGGLKKLFGGKRNTENGYVLIKEKDFDE